MADQINPTQDEGIATLRQAILESNRVITETVEDLRYVSDNLEAGARSEELDRLVLDFQEFLEEVNGVKQDLEDYLANVLQNLNIQDNLNNNNDQDNAGREGNNEELVGEEPSNQG
ncbi:hypothetical protein GCK72_025200 [Caenorhabditis remanei]|uniref:Uncharacterized protein n=1 Tax=Caenorhabditis remanei TaxID=31234 RepID=A0A6A5G1R0_CAERE|nr:hypothetical protein GCK72_025200 [Caenorhabditis remanei]KAF1748733.1 hypothetical protein GCK72_025200 [Caenorhabditis remanei]